jgi:creatinine amidohydrolase
LPCGAVEQHGAHLPLDVDIVCPTGIAHGAGRLIPDKLLVLPTVCYGYTGHVMDFPGTINNHFEHFIDHVLDITKSLAYHGFKKIVLLNGHGSNMPNLIWSRAARIWRPMRVHPDRRGGTCSRWTSHSSRAGVRANSRRLRPRLRTRDLALSLT